MKYETAGDPKTGLKWTRKATGKIARALQQEGIMISAKSVARILKKMGCSLRANRKKLALSGNGSKPERKKRNLHFCHIRSTRECFARQSQPIISIDTKKKELIGWNSMCLRYGLTVTICHYPTGASKWNPIEHRLFSEISKNWSGEPLVSLQTALNYIRTTKTQSGLRVAAMLKRKHYQCKEKITKQEAARILVQKDPIFPDLNYTLLPPK